jgi:hypothetical protein
MFGTLKLSVFLHTLTLIHIQPLIASICSNSKILHQIIDAAGLPLPLSMPGVCIRARSLGPAASLGAASPSSRLRRRCATGDSLQPPLSSSCLQWWTPRMAMTTYTIQPQVPDDWPLCNASSMHMHLCTQNPPHILSQPADVILQQLHPLS